MNKSYKTLQVSFTNFELNDPSQYIQDLGCYIHLKSGNGQQRIVDVVILSDQSNKAHIPITNQQDSIKLIIKRMSSNQVIGSITIQVADFHQVPVQAWQQWITIFETIEDDDYDGTLYEEDDSELPRGCFVFGLLEKEYKSPSPNKSIQNELTNQKQSQSGKSNQSPDAPIVNQFQTMGPSNHSSNKKKQSGSQVLSPAFENNSFNFGISESASPLIKRANPSQDSQDMQQLFLTRLELEKMTEFKKKYEHSKSVLQKMQKEYMELIQLYNKQNEESTNKMIQSNQELSQLKCHLEEVQRINIQISSELEYFKSQNQEKFLSQMSFSDEMRPQQSQKQQQLDNQRFIIEDMNKQIDALNQQIQQSEQMREKSEDRLAKLTGSINEQMGSWREERIQFLSDLSKLEFGYNQQTEIIKSYKEKNNRLSYQLKQRNEENNFLDREISRLIQECELSQKSVLQLTELLEEFKLKAVDEQQKLQDQLLKQSLEFTTIEQQKSELKQQVEMVLAQLNQYINVVGPISEFLNLQNQCKELQERKNELQQQMNNLLAQQNKNFETYKQQQANKLQNIKDNYEQKLASLQSRFLLIDQENKDSQNQLKQLQIEIIKLTGLLSQIKDENVKLQEENIHLKQVENDKENLFNQLFQSAEEQINKSTEISRPQSKLTEKYDSNNDVDSLLKEFMITINLPIKFKKSTREKYTFGTQTVQLISKNKKLIVKHENREMNILQFLRVYLVQEIILQSNGKIDPQYIQEWQTTINDLCNQEEECITNRKKSEERPLSRQLNWQRIKP